MKPRSVKPKKSSHWIPRTTARNFCPPAATNYHTKLFFSFLLLGRARDLLNQYDHAERAYNAATRIKPKDPLAWQGLVTLFEKQGQTKLDGYRNAAIRLAEYWMEV